MITKHFLKPAPIQAVQIQVGEQCRRDVAELTADRANPGSQRPDDSVVETPNGSTMAYVGDWLVKHENGDLEVFKDADFQEKYEPAAFAPHSE